VLAQGQTTTNSLALTLTATVAPGTAATVWVRAHDKGALSPWTTSAFVFWDVPAPASAGLADVAGALVANWAAVAVQNAPVATYDLLLVDESTPDAPVGALDGATGTSATVTRTDGQPPAAGAHYAATVRADVGGNLGPAATSDVLVVAVLPPPAAVTLALTDQAFALTWTAPAVPATITGPLSYDAALLTGATVVAQVTGLSTSSWAPALGTVLVPGTSYTAQVRALVPRHVSAEAASESVTVMGTPQITSASYASDKITVSWTPSTVPAATFELRAVPVGGGETVTATVDAPAATGALDVTGKPRGDYSVSVRGAAGHSAGPWSPAREVSVRDGVTGVSVRSDGTNLIFSWTPYPDATAYLVNVRNPQGNVVDHLEVLPPGPGEAPPATGMVAQAPYAPETAYTVTVEGMAGATPVLPSTPLPFTVPGVVGSVTVVSWDGTNVAVQWRASLGALGYLVTVRLGDTVVRSIEVGQPLTSLLIPSAGLQHAVTYSVVVQGQIHTLISMPNANRFTLIDAPAGVTATAKTSPLFSEIDVSWRASTGAQTYLMQLATATGLTVLTQNLTTTSTTLTGAEIVPGVTYNVRVSGVADIVGVPSAAVSVTVPVLYSCVCMGTVPGSTCGDHAAGGNYTDLALEITQQQLDTLFLPARTPNRSGWVAVPPGPTGEVAALGQLVGKLATKGLITGAEAFDVFANAMSTQFYLPGTGLLETACLGIEPGGACGAGGTDASFGTIYLGVSQSDVNTKFMPTRTTPSRTGWVSVFDLSYGALEVMLQLATLLAKKGTLAGNEPYDIFNQAMAVRISTGASGSMTCLALGSPVGQGTRTMNGRFGDVVAAVTPDELAQYQVGPASGWAALRQDYAPVDAVLVQLVALLARKGVLTGTEPYDVFNNATADNIS
jgi:hypothetical protein